MNKSTFSSRWLWGLALANLAVMAGFTLVKIPHTSATGETSPILAYEFAGTLARAEELLDAWDGDARIRLGFNLGYDYLYMAVYGAFLWLACGKLADSLPSGSVQARLGRWIGGLGVGAALLDVVENVALIRLLLGERNETLPAVAATCARVKFTLAGICLGYLVLGVVTRWVRRRAVTR